MMKPGSSKPQYVAHDGVDILGCHSPSREWPSGTSDRKRPSRDCTIPFLELKDATYLFPNGPPAI